MRYEISYNVEADANNWYGAANTTSYRSNWRKLIPHDILDKIDDVDEAEAMDFLIPYLKSKYLKEKTEIDSYIKYAKSQFDAHLDTACDKLEKITGKPIYTDKVTVYVTTIPRCPYNYKDAAFWININFQPIDVFMHEFLHFMFIHYYRENESHPLYDLNFKDFDWIKESLTVVLDEDCVPPMKKPDSGYPIHRDFRDKLHKKWVKNNNFDSLVDYCVKATEP